MHSPRRGSTSPGGGAVHWATRRFGGNSPLPRTGATVVPHGASLLLFGGTDAAGKLHGDVCELATGGLGWWSTVNALGAARPPPRAHAAVASHHARFYCFGGRTGDGVTDRAVYLLDSSHGKYIWSKPRVSGAVPAARERHVACAVRDSVFVFGGLVDGTTPSNDAFLLSAHTMQWTAVAVTTSPPPRAGHSAAAVGGVVYVFGGASAADGTGARDDLWAYHVSGSKWEHVARATPDWPPARSSHACAVVGTDLYVLGGRGSDGRALGDLWVYATKAGTWRNLSAAAGALQPQWDHSLCPIKTTLYALGGVADGGAATGDEAAILDTVKLTGQAKAAEEAVAAAASGAEPGGGAAGLLTPPTETALGGSGSGLLTSFRALQAQFEGGAAFADAGKSPGKTPLRACDGKLGLLTVDATPVETAGPVVRVSGLATSDADREIQRLRASLKATEQSLAQEAAARAKAHEQLNAARADLQRELAEAAAERERLQKVLAAKAPELAPQEAHPGRLQGLEQENAVLRDEIDRARAFLAQALESEQALTATLEHAQTTLTNAEAPRVRAPRVATLPADLLVTQEQLREMSLLTDAATGHELSPAEWKARADAAEAMVIALRTDLANANRELQQLREEIVTTQRRARQLIVNVTKLEEEGAFLQASLTQERARGSALHEAVGYVEKAAEEQLSQRIVIVGLNKQVEELREQAKQAELDKQAAAVAAARLADAQTRVASLEQAESALRQELAGVREQAEADKSALTVQLQRAELKLRRTSSQSAGDDLPKPARDDAAQGLREQLSRLTAELAAERQAQEQAAAEARQAQEQREEEWASERASLQVQLQRALRRTSSASPSLPSPDTRIQELEGRLAAAEADKAALQRLVDEATRSSSQLSQLQRTNSDLTERVSHLQHQLSLQSLPPTMPMRRVRFASERTLEVEAGPALNGDVSHVEVNHDAAAVFTRVQAALLAERIVVSLIANVQRDLIAGSVATNPTEETVATWVTDRVMVYAKMEALR